MSEIDQAQSREVRIRNPQGLHARPSHMFVERANQFESEVQVTRDGYAVNGKSITLLMTLAAECGAMLTIHTRGKDAAQALDALCGLIESGFGEG